MGYLDECWFSRLAQPNLCAWATEAPRLWEKSLPKGDKSAKAIACYGLLLPQYEEMLVRFCQGRPVSSVTTAFLGWVYPLLRERGVRVLVLLWDNARWHISREVKGWVRQHNKEVKKTGQGVRLLVHRLPSKSPWLNRIEPKWVHGKRAISEPQRVLEPAELAARVCGYFGCEHLDWL